jgi:tRNA (cytidine/uridine-2'-O-)-methyltransferase
VVGEIGAGLCVLLGIGQQDDQARANVLADKTKGLRIFADAAGKMNRSVLDIGGEVLLISQFTLYGDVRKGNRPSFSDAAEPTKAKALYEVFIDRLRAAGLTVATGRFGAHESRAGKRWTGYLDSRSLSMHVVLYEPEIPPNTGSIARLCAAALTRLHLIEPLGFKIDDKHLKRAGLDYWEFVDLRVHKSWNEFLHNEQPPRLLYFSKRAVRSYIQAHFQVEDYLVFGPETRGLPAEMLALDERCCYRIPMMGSGVRSLNLSNAVSIVLYEGLRQLGKT